MAVCVHATTCVDATQAGHIAMQHTELEGLKNATIPQLKALWCERGVKGKPPRFKQGLLRGIAHHQQGGSYPPIDAATKRLLKSAMKKAKVAGQASSKGNKPRQPQAASKLTTGTRLIRKWHGHDHIVVVLQNGKRFEYGGKEYANLSEIARHITGTRWSGPRFFGLHKLHSKA